MSRGQNPAIGTVPCPWAACTDTAVVKKFQHRAVRDTQRRYAGKLFAVCPVHGRFGSEATNAFQEYILENATLDGAEPPAPAPAPAAPPPAPAGAAAGQQRGTPAAATPARPAPTKPGRGWGFF